MEESGMRWKIMGWDGRECDKIEEFVLRRKRLESVQRVG